MMQQYFLSVEDHVFSSAAVAPWQSTNEVVEVVNEVVEVVLLPAAAVVVVLGDGAGASALVTQPRPSWKQHHVFFASDQPDSHLA
jgi:hypothetical protein